MFPLSKEYLKEVAKLLNLTYIDDILFKLDESTSKMNINYKNTTEIINLFNNRKINIAFAFKKGVEDNSVATRNQIILTALLQPLYAILIGYFNAIFNKITNPQELYKIISPIFLPFRKKLIKNAKYIDTSYTCDFLASLKVEWKKENVGII